MLLHEANILTKVVHIINKVPQDDVSNIIDTVFSDKIKKQEIVGEGMFGKVYKFIGIHGFSYAVKVILLARVENEKSPEMAYLHDANYLETLQENEIFPKLFFYIDGILQVKNSRKQRYMVMITQCINGFNFNDLNFDLTKRDKFVNNYNPEIIEKLKEGLKFTLNKGILPFDLHMNNIMFDMDKGIAVIVDVGNFEEQSLKERSVNYTDAKQHYSANKCIEEVSNLVKASLRTKKSLKIKVGVA